MVSCDGILELLKEAASDPSCGMAGEKGFLSERRSEAR